MSTSTEELESTTVSEVTDEPEMIGPQTLDTGAVVRKMNMEAFHSAGRLSGEKTLSEIYPYETLKVGYAIVFDENNKTHKKHASTIRVYAIRHGKETGKKFSFKVMEGPEGKKAVLLRVK